MPTLHAIYKISADITNLEATMTRGVAATERLDRSVTGMQSSVAMLARSVGVAGAVSAFGNLVSSAVELSGQLSDLSAKTGLSTTELQKLRGVGAQVGVSIDTIASSVNQLQNRLAGGDDSAIAALQTLGLTWQQLKDHSPDEQFRILIDRLGQIPNHADMVATGTDLMGRSFQQIIPLVKEGTDALDRISTMSPDTVRGLDAIGDAWTRMKQGFVTGAGEIVGSLMSVEGALGLVAAGMGGNVERIRDGWRLIRATVEDANDALPALLKAPAQYGKATAAAVTVSADQLKHIERTLDEQARTTTAALKAAMAERVRAMEQASAAAVKLYRESKAAEEALEAMYRAMLSDAVKSSFWGDKAQAQLHDDLDKTIEQIKLFRGVIEMPVKDGIVEFWETLHEAPPAIKEARSALDELSGSLAKLAQVSGGAFGDIARELAMLVTAMNAAQKAGAQMAKGGFTNIVAGGLTGAAAIGQATATGSTGARVGKGALTGMQIGMAFGPWGAAIGAAVGALTGWIRGMNQGRKAIKDFAESFGGFDALHQKLTILGADGERMWKQLTQSVANNDVQAAQAAITTIQNGLANIPQKLNAMVEAATTGGQALDMAMVPYIEDLIRSGQLTQENANLLLGLPAKGVPAFAEVEAAAEALGLDINALGEGIKQMRFAESANAIAANLDVLARAGADMDAVLTGSRDKIQKLVDDAQRFGFSLPEAIKPFLQQMVDAGKLTDLFGTQLTDLDDLHFTKPLEQSVEDLIAALHDLVGVITHDVGGALDAIGNKVVRPRIEVDAAAPGGGRPGGYVPPLEVNSTLEVDGRVLAESTSEHLVYGY